MKAYLLCFGLLFGLAGVARGDLVVSIDLDPDTPGIQSNRIASAGDTITAWIMFELTGTHGLSSYSFTVRFDSDELTFVSRNDTPPSGMNELVAGGSVEDPAGTDDPDLGAGVTYGEVSGFDAFTLSDGPESGTFNVGQIVFTASAPANGSGDVDILAGEYDLVDGFFDNDGFPIVPTFNGASVSAVPEPSTFALALVGMGGAWGVRRLRRRRSGVSQ